MASPKTVPLNWGVAVFAIIGVLLLQAYRIRIHSIEEHGPIIHDFDPCFNYRAAEYLYEHGWQKFFTWFDDMSWYPIGRPVGTTIYPGLQVTAVFIKNWILKTWSIVEICCYIPAWFGGIGSFLVGLIAYEAILAQQGVSGPSSSTGLSLLAVATGIIAMAMMAVIPAHLIRCVGGKFDNESVAVSAMIGTFYCWIRSLRNNNTVSKGYAVLAGIWYFSMAATWGGHIFVLNMIGVHAALSVLMGRFSHKLYFSYSFFFVVGTALAVQIPVVGWTPFTSLEQLGPCLVFIGYQVLQLCETVVKRRKSQLSEAQILELYFQVFTGTLILLGLVTVVLYNAGALRSVQSRVRMLLTSSHSSGNPLVDSVAEHQATGQNDYHKYLNLVGMIAPLGLLQIMLFHWKNNDSTVFLLCWGVITYIFSQKMSRLIVLASPIGCILAALFVGRVVMWSVHELLSNDATTGVDGDGRDAAVETTTRKSNGNYQQKKDSKQKQNGSTTSSRSDSVESKGTTSTKMFLDEIFASKEGMAIKHFVALLIPVLCCLLAKSFYSYSWEQVRELSNPKIIMEAKRNSDGKILNVRDFLEGSEWLRDNTEPDARILLWWPHGYRVAAVAKRTTLADGNTWNHDHLALIGKALTTNIEAGHEIVRHLADYVLVSSGGKPDDLARAPQMARVAHSVYRDHCPGDPACRQYGLVPPSSTMKASMLYQLHSHELEPGVQVDPEKFQEVYRSPYNKIRIFKVQGVSKESKAWATAPENKVCDTGKTSWICRGQYPPALESILSSKTDFERDDNYRRDYTEALKNPRVAEIQPVERETPEYSFTPPPLSDINKVYNNWEDSPHVDVMWEFISAYDMAQVKSLLHQDSKLAFVRNKMGRGPMWWAFERKNDELIKILLGLGVPHLDKDANGVAPPDLLSAQDRERFSKLLNIEMYSFTPPPLSEVNKVYNNWEDSPHVDVMWEFIIANDVNQVKALLHQDSKLAFVRSKDGRGPMWWAFESGNEEIIKILTNLGVPKSDRDAHGVSPLDLVVVHSRERLSNLSNSEEPADPEKAQKESLYRKREDTDQTSLMWAVISSRDVERLKSLLKNDSKLAFVRSKDGRGPMWWAFESRSEEIVTLLKSMGIPHTDRDAQGLLPEDMLSQDDRRESFLAKVL